MSDFIIHGIGFSPYVQAVSMTLAEKGESAILEPVVPGTLQLEPHLSRHPFGRMPVLEHHDFMLYETQAIIRYLDRLIPAPPLTPTDPRRAARMDQVMNIADHYLMIDVNRVIGFQRVVGPMLMGLTPDEAVIAEAMPRAQTVFRVLNEMLQGQDYFAGEALSLADIMVIPHINFLAMTPEWAELTATNRELVEWQELINARPSVPRFELPGAVRKAA